VLQAVSIAPSNKAGISRRYFIDSIIDYFTHIALYWDA
jgi:hypothetical protein